MDKDEELKTAVNETEEERWNNRFCWHKGDIIFEPPLDSKKEEPKQ